MQKRPIMLEANHGILCGVLEGLSKACVEDCLSFEAVCILSRWDVMRIRDMKIALMNKLTFATYSCHCLLQHLYLP